MPTDNEKIKKAFDEFEDDNYVDAEETLKSQIKKAKNDYLKKELDLEGDVEDIEPEDDDSDDDTDNDYDENNDDS